MEIIDLETFLRVCSTGSVGAAARELGVQSSTVTRRIARLESTTGTPLLDRQPQGARPTEAGWRVARIAESIVNKVRTLRGEASTVDERFVLLASPALCAALDLIPLLAELGDAFPNVACELVRGTQRVELIEGRTDMALRMHVSPLRGRPGLMGRSIASFHAGLYAAPSLLRELGPVEAGSALAALPTATLAGGLLRGHWHLLAPDGQVHVVPLRPRLHVSDVLCLREAATAGLAIAPLPNSLARPHLADGTLVRVLPEWTTQLVRVSVIWMRRDPLRPVVRACLDRIVQAAEGVDWG